MLECCFVIPCQITRKQALFFFLELLHLIACSFLVFVHLLGTTCLARCAFLILGSFFRHHFWTPLWWRMTATAGFRGNNLSRQPDLSSPDECLHSTVWLSRSCDQGFDAPSFPVHSALGLLWSLRGLCRQFIWQRKPDFIETWSVF